VILAEMLRQGKITQGAYEEAVAKEIVLCVSEGAHAARINSWYADMVIEDVIEALVRERGMSTSAASRLVYCGGLKIHTPMVLELQRCVTDFYLDPDHFPTHEGNKKAQSALDIKFCHHPITNARRLQRLF
jgi:penicillin-binding protein 1A